MLDLMQVKYKLSLKQAFFYDHQQQVVDDMRLVRALK